MAKPPACKTKCGDRSADHRKGCPRGKWLADAMRRDASSKALVRVLITDECGALLNSLEYDIEAIERALRDTGALSVATKNATVSQTFAARELAFIGDKAGDVVGEEIRALLRKRGRLQ